MASPARAQSIATSIWPSALGDSAKDVFSMMVGTEVTIVADRKLPVHANVTGVVGIGGAFSAVLTLRCSMTAGAKVAAQMLGVPADEATSQCADAIGEICNMVAGQFKAKVGHEATCMLSIPSVITGKNYAVHSARCSEIEIALLYDGEPIWITLDVRS